MSGSFPISAKVPPLNFPRFEIMLLVLFLTVPLGCSRTEADRTTSDVGEVEEMSLTFAKALSDRDYATAYSMTSEEFKSQYSLARLQEDFEAVVPTDWGTVGPIGVGEVMQEWPARKASDVAWVYVYIGGDVYSEGLSVVFTTESGALRIREVEFGRP
jgi:hypothetical protein